MTDNLLDAVEATLRAVDADAFRVVPVLRQQDAADVERDHARPRAGRDRALAALQRRSRDRVRRAAGPALPDALRRRADRRDGRGPRGGSLDRHGDGRPARRRARDRRLLRSERDEGAARRPPAQHRARAGDLQRAARRRRARRAPEPHRRRGPLDGRGDGRLCSAGRRPARRTRRASRATGSSGELYARYAREEAPVGRGRRRGRARRARPRRARRPRAAAAERRRAGRCRRRSRCGGACATGRSTGRTRRSRGSA